MEISITSKSWLLLGREAESTATSFKGCREFGPRDSQVRTRTDAATGEGAVTLRYLIPLLLNSINYLFVLPDLCQAIVKRLLKKNSFLSDYSIIC